MRAMAEESFLLAKELWIDACGIPADQASGPSAEVRGRHLQKFCNEEPCCPSV